MNDTTKNLQDYDTRMRKQGSAEYAGGNAREINNYAQLRFRMTCNSNREKEVLVSDHSLPSVGQQSIRIGDMRSAGTIADARWPINANTGEAYPM